MGVGGRDISLPARPTVRHAERLRAPLVFATFLAMLSLFGVSLWQHYEEALRRGQRQTEKLTYLLAEHLKGSVEALDATLQHLALHAQRSSSGPHSDTIVWQPVLETALSALKGVGSISILDETGAVRHSTVRQIVGQSRADRPLVQQLSRGLSQGLVTDPPFRSHVTGEVLIPLGRRLLNADGSFAGAVVATLQLTKLREFYRSVDPAPEGILWLLHPSGQLLIKEGGKTIRSQDLRLPVGLFQSPHGLIDAPLQPHGSLYLTAHRSISSPELVMAVSVPTSVLLREWRNEAFLGTLFLALIGAGILFASGMLSREQRARAKREAVLQQEAEERRLLFETTLDLIFITDNKGSFIRVSPSAVSILGYDPAEMIGQSAVAFIHPDDLEATRNEMRLARRGQGTRNFETRYLHKNRSAVTLAWSGVWSQAEQKHFFIGRDCTERTRHEGELKVQNEKLDAALSNMTQGLAMFDSDMRVIVANERFGEMYGQTPDQVKPGTPLRDIVQHRIDRGIYFNTSADEVIGRMRDRVARKTTSHMTSRMGDGRILTVSIQPRPDGGWVTTHLDVTEREKLKDQLDVALNNMVHGLAMFDAELGLVLCNKRYLELYGLTVDQAQPGTTVREILSLCVANGCYAGRDPDVLLEAARQRLGLEKLGYYETRLSNGRVHGVSVQPMTGGGFVTTHEDITDRRRLEAQLREQNRRLLDHERQLESQNLKLDAALKNMTQGLCMFGPDEVLVLCNEQYRAMYSLANDDVAPGTSFRTHLERRVAQGTYPKGPAPEAHLAAIRRSSEKDFETTRLTELNDGRFISVANRMMPDGGWVATHQDVTELRKVERSLIAARAAAEAAAKEARAAHSILLDAFEVVPEGIVLFDAEDRFVLWNKRYAELYSTKIKRGMRFEDLLRSEMKLGQYPDGLGREDQWIAERLARHRQPHHSQELQLAGGRWIHIHEHRTANGGAIGVRIDITAHKLREEELNKQNMILDAALNNMSQGLILFDADRKLMVCNKRYLEIYGLTPDQVRPGTPIADLIQHRLALGLKIASDPNAYVRARVDGPVTATNAFHEFADGRTIAYAVRPLPAGGGVATHEDVTEQRRIEARIAHMAHHDALTDLPNRVLLRHRLEEALERDKVGSTIAVLCLDLDRFKEVNDALGHAVGDGLLKQVSERLRRCVRGRDTVARIGGDEFAIIQRDADQPIGATTLALRVIEEISTPYQVEGHQLVTGTSIGISLYPNDAREAEQLLKNADLALYRAKSEGRGTYRFFEPQMDSRMHARRKLELDLRQAISDGAFELHYQPIVDLALNEVSTFEALLRWNHPERGRVSPAEFIPLAEETGLIKPIGEWVLRAACAEAVNWPANVKVAVNLSSLQFKQNDIVQLVFNALGTSGLAPSRLELEITESTLLENTERNMTTLHMLRKLGVRLSMDDFGTGYSSLSNLRNFPFDKIKIDQSFIHGLGSDAHCSTIVATIVALGAGLGMTTTAEGVETEETLLELRALGVGEVQGYHLGRPAPPSEVRAMLASVAKRKQVAA